MSTGRIPDFSLPLGATERRAEARNLRAWLHRIDEACARKGASPELAAIRRAAITALSGAPAPDEGLQAKGTHP